MKRPRYSPPRNQSLLRGKGQTTKQSKPDVQLVTKQHRTNLTLKVLAENEARFNELFFRLQLKGDGRKKQDLADEALQMLFSKYSHVLR